MADKDRSVSGDVLLGAGPFESCDVTLGSDVLNLRNLGVSME